VVIHLLSLTVTEAMASEHDGSNGSLKCNSQNSTKASSAIDVERAKSSLTFKEIIAPGHTVELELRRILAGPVQSEYQKVEILETYFGKVSLYFAFKFWGYCSSRRSYAPLVCAC
jgi:hypothetical protein